MGLYHASKFLIPVAFGGFFSMLLLPISNWLERKGISRGFAVALSVLLLFVTLVAFVTFLVFQISNFASDLPTIHAQLSQTLQEVRSFIESKTGISVGQEFSNLGSIVTSYISNIASAAKSFVFGTFKAIVGLVIVLVYVTLFLYYRNVIFEFIIKLSPKENKAAIISSEVTKVSYQYLGGKLIVIVIIAVLNSAGLYFIGVKQAIFFGVLAAFLDIIPFIGIIIGAGLPVIMTLISPDPIWKTFAVMGLFTFSQLLENYFLTPKVIGSHVHLNPLFTLMIVLIGGYLWGVAGMILFIPLLAMAKVLFDHIEPLNPYGFLIGDPNERTEKS